MLILLFPIATINKNVDFITTNELPQSRGGSGTGTSGAISQNGEVAKTKENRDFVLVSQKQETNNSGKPYAEIWTKVKASFSFKTWKNIDLIIKMR